MALPPTIPTSFVPKQPVTTSAKHRTSGANPFLALAYLVTGIVVLGCFVVFGYQLYLENIAKQKANSVVVAQNSIDQATVTEFIRLRDRFTEAKGILDKHIVLSGFFSDLENLTLQGVRFAGLTISVADDRTATISMDGTARSFNALAAQSAELATDKRIKRAIFSGINLSPKDGSVSFALSAELDPTLVTQTPTAAGAAPSNPLPTTPVTPPVTTPPAASTTPTGAATPGAKATPPATPAQP